MTFQIGHLSQMRIEKFREKKRYISFSTAAIVVTVGAYPLFMKVVNLSAYDFPETCVPVEGIFQGLWGK